MNVDSLLHRWPHTTGALWCAAALVVSIVLACAVRRVRSHRSYQRDPLRVFSQQDKATVSAWCGGRCEHKSLLLPRCRARGTAGDHLVPHSKGGPTTLENLQMLCTRHNLRKSNKTPSRLYLYRLAARRRAYFPDGQPRLPRR
ncbi:HNH endonuclease [Branchiibius cervicis]|uniref:HNH endonuclease n=1 Tax=Branchiibius cervicis TaxID=908252 RepID=A0ABW2AUI8_9MICO